MSLYLFYLLILSLPVQLGKHFWPKESLVSGIRVDYLSPTIYLTDIIIIFLLAVWFWENKKKIKGFPSRGFIFILLGLLPYFFFTVLPSGNKLTAFYQFIKISEFLAVGLFIIREKPKIFSFAVPLSFAMLFSSILAILQFLKQSSLGGLFWFFGERTFSASTPGIAQIDIGGRLFLRPYATFPHPNVLAGFLIFSLTILTVYFTDKERSLSKRSKLIYIFILFISFTALMLTASISAYISLLVGMILLLWDRGKKSFTAKQTSFIAFLVLAAVLFVAQFYIKTNAANFSENISFRSQLSLISLEMIRQKPFFGVGLNNFIPSLPAYITIHEKIFWWQPVHSLFLLLASETGIIGLFIFLTLPALAFKKSFKLFRQKVGLPLILLTEVLIIGLFDHYLLTLQQGQILLTLVFALAFLPKNSYT